MAMLRGGRRKPVAPKTTWRHHPNREVSVYSEANLSENGNSDYDDSKHVEAHAGFEYDTLLPRLRKVTKVPHTTAPESGANRRSMYAIVEDASESESCYSNAGETSTENSMTTEAGSEPSRATSANNSTTAAGKIPMIDEDYKQDSDNTMFETSRHSNRIFQPDEGISLPATMDFGSSHGPSLRYQADVAEQVSRSQTTYQNGNCYEGRSWRRNSFNSTTAHGHASFDIPDHLQLSADCGAHCTKILQQDARRLWQDRDLVQAIDSLLEHFETMRENVMIEVARRHAQRSVHRSAIEKEFVEWRQIEMVEEMRRQRMCAE